MKSGPAKRIRSVPGEAWGILEYLKNAKKHSTARTICSLAMPLARLTPMQQRRRREKAGGNQANLGPGTYRMSGAEDASTGIEIVIQFSQQGRRNDPSGSINQRPRSRF